MGLSIAVTLAILIDAQVHEVKTVAFLTKHFSASKISLAASPAVCSALAIGIIRD